MLTLHDAVALTDSTDWAGLLSMPHLETFPHPAFGTMVVVADAESGNDWYRITIAIGRPGTVWIDGCIAGEVTSHCIGIS